MNEYKTELENAITGADDLICTMNTIGDSMETGERAAVDYVGAVRVLAQATASHARDLKAIRLCQTWEDKAEAEGKNTLLRLTDELTHARNYLERVELLIGGIEEEYFNENANNPNTASGKDYILAAFDENRIKTNIVRDYVTQVREALYGGFAICDKSRGGETRMMKVKKITPTGSATFEDAAEQPTQ